MNSPYLKTIRVALDTLVAQRSSFDQDQGTDNAMLDAADTALNQLSDALLKAQTELSFYARNAADYASDEHDEIVERASGYLCDDHGQGAEQALAALGMECLPPSDEEITSEKT